MMLGLGADVSVTGQVNNPFWCSLIPGASSLSSSCKPPTAEELQIAQDNINACSANARTVYPTTSALLGGAGACHLAAGDYNGWLAAGAALLGLLLFVQMK